MKILHLSDLHFTSDDVANQPLLDRIQYISSSYPNHFIVVTGDIIDGEGALLPGAPHPVPSGVDGLPTVIPAYLDSPPPLVGPLTSPHLDSFKTSLTNAFNALKLLPQGKVIVCSGNHDYGLWGNVYFDNLAPTFDDLLFMPLLNRGGPVDGSSLFIASLYPDEPSLSATKPLLYTLSSDGVSVGLVSVATAFSSPDILPTFSLATGVVGGRQLTALQNGPLNPLAPINFFATIVMMHHHPWPHGSATATKLNDADQLLALVRNHADLIMFGHQHVEKRWEPANVPGGGIRAGALAAGSSRRETGAWEVTIDPPSPGSLQANYSFARVPIIA
jgi:3',5'-cyclic AMP phosphodiesterase CpdA